MNKLKLHQWLPLLSLVAIFTSCSQKELPENNSINEDKYENSKPKAAKYTPPQVIAITDDLAKSTKDGEMYYDDKDGYRYWRQSDGKYYLDEKYLAGASPNKKLAKKNTKQQNKQQGDSYPHQ